MSLVLIISAVFLTLLCFIRRPAAASTPKRLAICAGGLTLAWAGQWLIRMAIQVPHVVQDLTRDWLLVCMCTLIAYAGGASRVTWKYVYQISVFIFAFGWAYELHRLLVYLPDHAWRAWLEYVWPLFFAVTFLAVLGYTFRVEFRALYQLLCQLQQRLPNGSIRALSPAVIVVLGTFLLIPLRSIILDNGAFTPSSTAVVVLITNATFVAAMVYFASTLLRMAYPNAVSPSFQIAAVLDGTIIYALLSHAPDVRCLPFLIGLPALSAWHRWSASSLWGTLVALLLISITHAALAPIASYGPRLCLYFAITCFSYGYFFLPPAATVRQPA